MEYKRKPANWRRKRRRPAGPITAARKGRKLEFGRSDYSRVRKGRAPIN